MSLRTFLFGGVVLASAAARAGPTKQECIDADTQAQVLRDRGKLRAARAQLDLCTQSACPAVVRQDCAERLDELTRIAPTVVFDVKDALGVDMLSTRVTMDGELLADHLDGRGVAVDPGPHTFTFEAVGHVTSSQHVLVREADKDRHVIVVLASAPLPHPSPAQRTAGWIVGGTGVLGLGLAGVFTIVSAATWKSSQNECNSMSCKSPVQAQADHNTAYDFAVAATALVIGGGVVAATGLLVVLMAPRSHDARAALRAVPLLGSVRGVALAGVF